MVFTRFQLPSRSLTRHAAAPRTAPPARPARPGSGSTPAPAHAAPPNEVSALALVRSVNATRGTLLAPRVVWATGAAKRRGLLGRTHLAADEGMYLVPCQWIHTFGMRFAIDVAFLARDGRVLAVHHALPPQRLSRLELRADGVLELAAGVLQATGTVPGDVVELLEP